MRYNVGKKKSADLFKREFNNECFFFAGGGRKSLAKFAMQNVVEKTRKMGLVVTKNYYYPRGVPEPENITRVQEKLEQYLTKSQRHFSVQVKIDIIP